MSWFSCTWMENLGHFQPQPLNLKLSREFSTSAFSSSTLCHSIWYFVLLFFVELEYSVLCFFESRDTLIPCSFGKLFSSQELFIFLQMNCKIRFCKEEWLYTLFPRFPTSTIYNFENSQAFGMDSVFWLFWILDRVTLHKHFSIRTGS